MPKLTAIVGQIIHCVKPYELEVIDGFVIFDDNGKIQSVGKGAFPAQETEPSVRTLSKTQLLIPGLIDTHIHAPQYPNVGLGYDKPLLDWLKDYTYELEKKYKDLEFSRKVYEAVVQKTLSYGTTTACYFGSLFQESTLVLAHAVKKFGQRALVGKVNMTTLAPSDYVENSVQSIENTLTFIEKIQGLGSSLIQPVITPRFALSLSLDDMKKLGAIAKEKNLHIQSHISENQTEVEEVKKKFKESYAEVYNAANLLTPKTVLAHGVHLTDDEINLINKTQSSISHCPNSNICLKSGNCDVANLKNKGVTVGLGTDVAGGCSPSILETMRAAITASTNVSFGKTNYEPLTYVDVFYLATLGGAKALALDDKIGNFQIGKDFDALIVDLNVTNSSADYLSESLTSEELLQKLVFVGDDRNVINVFVNGRNVKV